MSEEKVGLCSCSERPMGVIASAYCAEENIPYQKLFFGCTNKKCERYKKPAYEVTINLLDNSETIIKL